MAGPVDDWGRYRVVLPLDALTRLGFSQAGAQQLSAALPLTQSRDRVLLAALLDRYSAAAGPQLGSRERLQAAGLSAAGADQAAGGSVVAAHSDRLRLASVVAAIAAGAGGTTAAIYDYPGAYADRFDPPPG